MFTGEALADITFDDIPSLIPIKDETTATLEKIMEREKLGPKFYSSVRKTAWREQAFVTEPEEAANSVRAISPEEMKRQEEKERKEMLLKHVR